MSIPSIGGFSPAPATSASPDKAGKSDDAARRAEAQAKAEAKAAEERAAAAKGKPSKSTNDDEVPKGFKPEVASSQLAALLSSTIAAI